MIDEFNSIRFNCIWSAINFSWSANSQQSYLKTLCTFQKEKTAPRASSALSVPFESAAGARNSPTFNRKKHRAEPDSGCKFIQWTKQFLGEFVCLFVFFFCVWKINTSNSHAPESCLESTAGTWNPCEECSIRVTRVADQIRSVMSFYFQQGTHAHAHPHAHTVEAARSRWSPRRGSRWRSDSLRLRSSSAARTPGYVPPSARLHLRRSLLEISRWRRSLVGTSFPPGRHALLLDTRRVDPRRRTPLWTSRQGMVSFFNVMCWR